MMEPMTEPTREPEVCSVIQNLRAENAALKQQLAAAQRALAITDAEREVITAAEYEVDTNVYVTEQLVDAVRRLREGLTTSN